MSPRKDDAEAALAGRIRLERDTRRWSLADLAQRSGVSKAAIHNIERGEASPTAANLVKLAGAFGLTLAGLLLRAERGASPVMRRGGQPSWTDPATGYMRRQLFLAAENPVELVDVRLPAGARVAFPASAYAHIRQVAHVTGGALVVVEGSRRFELASGDSFGFGEPADVTFANETAAECRYLIALARR